MSTARSTGPPEDPLVLFEILQTARLADRAFTAAFAGVGMPPGQFGLLATVNDEPGLTQADVARRLLVRPQSIARQVTQLIESGLIEPEKRPRQGSATGLFITAAGIERLDAAWPAVQAINAPDELGITEDDAATLVRVLEQIRDRLDGTSARTGRVGRRSV